MSKRLYQSPHACLQAKESNIEWGGVPTRNISRKQRISFLSSSRFLISKVWSSFSSFPLDNFLFPTKSHRSTCSPLIYHTVLPISSCRRSLNSYCLYRFVYQIRIVYGNGSQTVGRDPQGSPKLFSKGLPRYF